MNAWFKEDYSEKGIPRDIFQEVYNEYADTTEAYISELFDKKAYIHSIKDRINGVAMNITWQLKFLEEFGVPYKEKFWIFEEYGYFLSFVDNDSFIKELERIASEETVFTTELDICAKEYKELQDAEDQQPKTPLKKQRENFIKNINTLGKIGYKIEIDKTTVEEYALMIKQQHEEVASSDN